MFPAIEAVAVRPDMSEFLRWDDGRLLSRTLLGDEIERAHGAPYVHVHRADLVAILAAALPAGSVRTGRRCSTARRCRGGAPGR